MLRRFYCPDLTRSSSLELSPEESHHAAIVLRLKTGDRIELFDGKGHAAPGTITQSAKRCVRLERGEVVKKDRYPLAIHLAQAVPHRKKIDDIVEKCEELAVSKMILLKSDHTVFDFKKDAFKKLIERLELLVLEGAKQSRNNYLMEVEGWKSAEDLIATFSDYSRVFLMSPEAPYEKEPFTGVTDISKPILILIGPEGGFSYQEELRFKETGAWPLSLGEILLKCDTAAVAAVSILKYCFERSR